MREKKKKNNKSDRLYTTLEELNKEFYTRDLPQYNLNF